MSSPAASDLLKEIERLRSEAGALQQLLQALESTALAQARKLENILNSTSDGLVVLTRSWRIIFVNRVAEAVMARSGKRSSDILGRNLWQEFPELAGTDVERHYRRAMDDRVPVSFEMRDAPTDSWFEVRVFPSEDGISVLFQDITQRKHSEVEREDLLRREREARQQLEARTAEVESLNRTLEEKVAQRTADLQALLTEMESFSYSVSHDLRAPLRTIDGFTAALMEDYGGSFDEVAKSYMEAVRSATTKMAELIEALLQLSRVSRTEMEYQEVDLARLATEICQDLELSFPGEKRKVEWQVERGVTAVADPRLVRVVLQNLFSNAWKFTSKQICPAVSFGITQTAGEAACYIRDNGAGYDPKMAGRLFKPFQRLHRPTDFDGTGIGLATVQRIISRHRGKIWAEGEPGRGATFFFTLPGLRKRVEEER